MPRKFSKVLGIIFILAGLLGFIPNPLFGEGALFHTDLVHDLLHIVLGIILLITAKTEESARLWLKIIGALYLVLAILGFLAIGADGIGTVLGIAEVNALDNWLHVVLGIVALAGGFSGSKHMAPPAAPSGPTPSM